MVIQHHLEAHKIVNIEDDGENEVCGLFSLAVQPQVSPQFYYFAAIYKH